MKNNSELDRLRATIRANTIIRIGLAVTASVIFTGGAIANGITHQWVDVTICASAAIYPAILALELKADLKQQAKNKRAFENEMALIELRCIALRFVNTYHEDWGTSLYKDALDALMKADGFAPVIPADEHLVREAMETQS